MVENPDGILRTKGSRSSWPRAATGLAAVLIAGVLGWLWLEPAAPPPPPEAAPPSGSHAAPPPVKEAAKVSTPPAPPPGPLDRAIEQALAQAPPPQPAEEQREVYVDQLGKGDGTGIYAFPKPGTKPLRSGIIVPDGFELPEGYVRHYQTTDDGEQLPPILIFHPDYQPRDAQGRPIAVPLDRVVPPELAPKGMPLDRLEAPPFREER